MHLLSSQFTAQPAVLQSLLEKTERLENDMRSLVLHQSHGPTQMSDETTNHSNSSSDPFRRRERQVPQRALRSATKMEVGEAKNISLGIYKRFSSWRGLFDMAVQMSLKITFGFGGCAILNNPRFHPTVADDSPAFALVKLAVLNMMHGEVRIESVHQELLELFRSGQASPLDTLPHGETLLHVSFV